MKSKKTSVWIWLILVLVIVILIGRGAYFLGKKNSQNSENQANVNEDKQNLDVSKIQEPIELQGKDWNNDPKGDSLILYSLAPKDSEDRAVKSSGSFNVKLEEEKL